jgi:transposase-like protein
MLPPFDGREREERYGSTILLKEIVRRAEALSAGVPAACSGSARVGRPVLDVAASLGIAQSCLYRWRQQDLADRGLVSPSREAIESAALAEARARIAELENEVKILRKGSSVPHHTRPRHR